MNPDQRQRLRLLIRGAVQGVGFRPFIFRLAKDLRLAGWVCNNSIGVLVEVEGPRELLHQFLLQVGRDYPARATIEGMEPVFLDPAGYVDFEIRESGAGDVKAWILPDIATCEACRREIFDPRNRRFRYPFTNCTHCGPRYTIVSRLPYDRVNTSMKKFRMCPACEREYQDPQDRRFHAQPNACPDCGPQLQLWSERGEILEEGDGALKQAVTLLRDGNIVAVKGLGGFHLFVDAANEDAVLLLRRRKNRFGKPLALMIPDLSLVKKVCEVNPLEERLLTSPECPIVLLKRSGQGDISGHVAPANPYLGVMLPYSPLHLLLLHDLGRPVVATSGNLSEETICTEEGEALERLKGIASHFLVHDRPILRAVDDSVVRVILNREQIVRRARGYAPLPIAVRENLPPTLAVGGHLKNCIAMADGQNVFVSQHIGDLETAQSFEVFQKVIGDFKDLFQIEPEQVVCDLHEDYPSARVAHGMKHPVFDIQHHEAHVFSCMADNDLVPPVLGISWDGSGAGYDGTVWGGEFLTVTEEGVKRFAHFEPFPLPGGEAAVRDPKRSLLGALFAFYGEKVFKDPFVKYFNEFSAREWEALRAMLIKKINAPVTSSVGRRFDAVSALTGLCCQNTFEGEAAMAMEFSLSGTPCEEHYGFRITPDASGTHVVKAPLWDELLSEVEHGVSREKIAAKFHNMLVEIMVEVVRLSEMGRVVLTGGCFQNRYLTEQAVRRLQAEGAKVYWHQRVPANDGGLALGQVFAVKHLKRQAYGSAVFQQTKG